MKKLKRKMMRASVEAYGCMTCYGSPEGCMASCNSDVNAMQSGLQAQLDIQYLTIYY